MAAGDEIVQFTPWTTFVDLSFWHEYGKRKLNIYKLSEAPVSLCGCYAAARATGKSGEEGSSAPSLPAIFVVGMESFQEPSEYAPPPFHYACVGQATNFNTQEGFHEFDKAAAFHAAGQQIWDDIASGQALRQPSLLNRWILLSYMDLKKFIHRSIFGFPALKFRSALRGRWEAIHTFFSPKQLDAFSQAYQEAHSKSSASTGTFSGYFLVRTGADDTLQTETDLTRFREFFADLPAGSAPIVAFADPSTLVEHPGWPLRNFLVLLSHHFGPIPTLKAIGIRTTSSLLDLSASVVFTINDIPSSEGQEWHSPTTLTVTGWERDSKGRTAPKIFRLAKVLDPVQLAATSVSLNLSLMRWRVMPSLDLDKIAKTRVLLLGAGTLGCNVARLLLGWGVHQFVFVDSGRVSFSNPARQCLFNFEDARRQRPKAVAAAEALQAIVPTVTAQGHSFEIPMPGHPVSAAQEDAVRRDVDLLVRLIDEADVVFLLTDSRESRWLPTMLCAAANKLCIDAALGFDTYLVMRHGLRPSPPYAGASTEETGVHLGCYFCNDVVAPRDSLSNRTLDQQCTVTRPGVSVLASSLACELLISVLQHPLGACAPGDVNHPPLEPVPLPLGLIPHQVRGYLTHYANLLVVGTAFDRCTACSQNILDAYRASGFSFILNALNDPLSLEQTSKVAELHEESSSFGGLEAFSDSDSE